MKAIINFLAKSIYLFLVWLDRKIGKYEGFRGETAPYCGHGYNGHTGYFTQSSFHEGDGGGESKGWFYYESKRWFQLLSVKIEYPQGKRTLYIRVVHFRPRLRRYIAGGMTLHVIRLRGIIPVSHNPISI